MFKTAKANRFAFRNVHCIKFLQIGKSDLVLDPDGEYLLQSMAI